MNPEASDSPEFSMSIEEIVAARLAFGRRHSEWYRKKKREKQSMSRALRGVGTAFVVVGGIAPVVNAAWPAVPLILGYIAIGSGGALFIIDRLIGTSSSWMRFMLAAIEIEAATESFRIETVLQKIRNTGTEESIVEICLRYTNSINGIVRGETAEWIAEFARRIDDAGALSKIK